MYESPALKDVGSLADLTRDPVVNKIGHQADVLSNLVPNLAGSFVTVP